MRELSRMKDEAQRLRDEFKSSAVVTPEDAAALAGLLFDVVERLWLEDEIEYERRLMG